MCTYATYQCDVAGSGKTAAGWVGLRQATVYIDHPVHARPEHTVNIDFADPARGPAARVAVELHTESAMDLVTALARALVDSPRDISGLTDDQHRRLSGVLSPAASPAV